MSVPASVRAQVSGPVLPFPAPARHMSAKTAPGCTDASCDASPSTTRRARAGSAAITRAMSDRSTIDPSSRMSASTGRGRRAPRSRPRSHRCTVVACASYPSSAGALGASSRWRPRTASWRRAAALPVGAASAIPTRCDQSEVEKQGHDGGRDGGLAGAGAARHHAEPAAYRGPGRHPGRIVGRGAGKEPVELGLERSRIEPRTGRRRDRPARLAVASGGGRRRRRDSTPERLRSGREAP